MISTTARIALHEMNMLENWEDAMNYIAFEQFCLFAMKIERFFSLHIPV